MPVLRNILAIFCGVVLLVPASGQQPATEPQVKLNMLNVCSPSPEDKQEISSALARIPRQPPFNADFEIDRGRTTLDEAPSFLQAGVNARVADEIPISNWVRIRREFSKQSPFSTVQYSFSVDSKSMLETLAFRLRDPKDLLQVVIEDSASAVTTPAAMLATNTPATRIKLERFGKSSIVLARCLATEGSPAPDQSAYEPLFQSASAIVASYRTQLAVRSTVPDELARVAAFGAKRSVSSAKGGSKSTPKQKN